MSTTGNRTLQLVTVTILAMWKPSSAFAEEGAPEVKAAAKSGNAKAAKKRLPRAGPALTPEEIALCAEEEVTRLRAPPPPVELLDEPIHLRDRPIEMAEDGCERSIKRWNFAKDRSQTGCFVNAFVWGGYGGRVLPDLATGLMWEVRASPKVDFEGAKKHVDSCNDQRLGGYSGWRLPTTEEFLSTLDGIRYQNEYHLDTNLFDAERSWWTSDYFHVDRFFLRWYVDTLNVRCDPVDPAKDPTKEYSKSFTRAVRTMTKDEMKAIRAEYEKRKASVQGK